MPNTSIGSQGIAFKYLTGSCTKMQLPCIKTFMKHASLAAHYRPQTFAEVTGQDMITTVLSRAAAEDRVAAAYLLSGTRGVGKTTIARILAKALNCEKAPTAEPCNQCANCQMITKGNHVDVTEIDGASNNSVEDARSLRENIGYAPMEGRYKVFIIDEAHMLSRSAFNALLKTLEEPPPRVVFIFATTEVHKFPITIVSRCQHFIFKRLSEDGLVAHLSRVLTKENVNFDPQAVRTIARRANGSVRDSMSLLGQTLALGDSTLSMESTRAVLGLAGQELFITLLEAVARQDCPAVIELMQKLSDQGIDMGFFLRELINIWRTLFLLREAGQAIIPSLGLGEEDSAQWLALCAKFSAPHLHAAWHMTLDAQRKVIHSPEPAAALELLLVNLTLMPRLLPLQAATPPSASSHTEDEKKNFTSPLASASSTAPQTAVQPVPEPETHFMPTARQTAHMGQNRQNTQAAEAPHIRPPWESAEEDTKQHTAPMHAPTPSLHTSSSQEGSTYPEMQNHQIPSSASSPMVNAKTPAPPVPQAPAKPSVHAMPSSSAQATSQPTWDDIRSYLAEQSTPIIPDIFLQQATGIFKEKTLHIHTKSLAVYDKIERLREELHMALQGMNAGSFPVLVHKPTKTIKTESALVEEFNARADLKDCLEILSASIYKVRPLNDT